MRAILLLLIAALLFGCGSKHSLVGEWDTHIGVGSGKMIFRDDCTFHSSREAPMASLTLDGTYELKGENLRMHIVKWGVPHGPELTMDERKAINHAFLTDSITTVSWTDDDHIRLTAADGQLTTAERSRK